MGETRGITVRIDAELHNQVKAEQEALGFTMSQYMEKILIEHFNPIRRKEEKDMGPKRTLAFQVSEDLFQRVKDYLRKNNLSQKDFVIGLIEDELERFEMTEQQKSADSNEGYEDENTELDEDGSEATESPCVDDWESDASSDTTNREDATEGQQDADEAPGEDEDLAEVEDDSFDDEEDEDNEMGMEPLM